MKAVAATMDSPLALSFEPAAASPRSRGPWHIAEDLVVATALGVMVGLPLIEIVARTFFHSGIVNTASIVQHLTLFVGMAGGALAARDGRLLALSTATWLHGATRRRAGWFSHVIAAAVTLTLAFAAVKFVAAEREGAQLFSPRVPLWMVQCVLPLGFGVIALRLWYQSSPKWRGRIFAGLAVAALIAVLAFVPVSPRVLLMPALALLLVATALGAPIFTAVGGAGLLLFWAADLPLAAMSVEHYRLTVNPALPSIPLFTLAGFFMAEGGASRRLMRVFSAWCGWFRGGTAIAVTLICAFFTSFTGASGVTILALAALLMPVLRAAKFSERDSLGLITGAGSLGVLLPPCLPVILYAIIAHVDIKQMFLGGFGPGVLLIAMTASWGIWAGRRRVAAPPRFNPREARRAVWAAKWELLLPVVALVALFGGWATPVEAAALTAALAFVIEFIIHRNLRIMADGPRVAGEAGLLVGGVLLILGVALGLTNYLIDAQVPDQLAAWAGDHVHSRWLFLLGLNVVLIFVGSVVEIYAAIVVIAPLLAPIGVRLGIDPVHLGIIFLANMELGFLAPPLGLNLLLSSYRLGKPVSEVARAVLPLLLVMFLGVLLITYCPPLTTALPQLFSAPP